MKNSLSSNQVLRVLILSISLVTLVSCGSRKPMVTDISVSPYYENSEVNVSIDAKLSLGNVTLPQTSFPIFHPRNFQEIGSVEMGVIGDGQNELSLNINLSQIANINSSISTLPNGGVLPLIGTSETIAIPLNKGVVLYLTFNDGQAALGVAIPFKTLDRVGSKVGTTALFPVFNIKQVFGAAGIYTSRESGKNGFGLFMDISSVLDQAMFIELNKKHAPMDMALKANSIIPSSKTESRINKEMYNLHRKRKALSLN